MQLSLDRKGIDGIACRGGKGEDDQKGDHTDGKSRRISPQAEARMDLQCSIAIVRTENAIVPTQRRAEKHKNP